MPDVIIQRRKRQSRYFSEDLGHGIGMDMVLIRGGQFLMGSPANELDRKDSEVPQHLVTVSTFVMGRYPVTQAQWQAVASLPQINRELDSDPSHFKGENRPVERVNWYDAVEWCDRLSRHTKRTYRLPSEAEWEYACRAGTTTPFHFGETITTELANYYGIDDESMGWSGSYGQGPKGEYREETTPVDQFKVANAFGLSDMHGNVWEWCLDHWHENYEGAPIDGSAWDVDGESNRRILRGGSWFNIPGYCRSATRNYLFTPDNRTNYIGFRVVCEMP